MTMANCPRMFIDPGALGSPHTPVSRRRTPSKMRRLLAIVSSWPTAVHPPETEAVNPSKEDQLVI